MDEYTLIQDLSVVLLAAGIAGTLCRRLGLSVVVGYLLAGIIIGPHTPPFSLVTDVTRIQTLSQVGLVFLMFGIGLGLSLSKIGRIGWSMLVATGLGALLMLNLTKLLGFGVGWTPTQSLFLAAMFMVSSSAVIAKIIGELNLSHERSSQLALGITVLEDVVAVVMLTILASQSAGGDANIGKLLGGMTAFIVLLVGAGLVMVPRLMRRLEARADPELQTIVVAGVLFLLSIAAVKAGYSLALGAFLLGAIVAEIPQKASVEKSFNGMRDLFSSVFFVSIGMMIDPSLWLDVWPLVLGLAIFALLARAFALSLALILCGNRPREARRAGLLLTPLGEFSFIIAQLGVSVGVLPKNYYPLAVGVSIFTVLAVPWINRHADKVLDFLEKMEPRWLSRGYDAYHGWLEQVKTTSAPSTVWRLIKGRLVQIAVEMLFITGVMTFARPLLSLLLRNTEWIKVEPSTLTYAFWGGVTILALIPLVAIWRSLGTIAMILGESFGGVARLPANVLQNGVKAAGAVLLGYWLFAILPTDQLDMWGWAFIALAAAGVVAVFSSRLIYWQSHLQSSVSEVLAEDPRDVSAAVAEAARGKRARDLEQWELRLIDCVVPEGAPYAGRTLAEISIPARYGCAVLEIERNGHVITAVRPDVRLYPGDKLLLLGPDAQLTAACDYLSSEAERRHEADEFRGSVLETFEIPGGARSGSTLKELNLGKVTGTRVVGIQRGTDRIIAPSGEERLHEGDSVLVAGTLSEIAAFRRWLNASAERRSVDLRSVQT